MVKKKDVVFIDSNVFIIDLRYQNDRNFKHNQRFLKSIRFKGCGLTSMINLLEIIGILSFNLNPRQLTEFYTYFPQRYNIKVIPSLPIDSSLPELGTGRLLEIMAKKTSFGDALVIAAAEAYIPNASHFVTWDREHFINKPEMEVIDPVEFLRRS